MLLHPLLHQFSRLYRTRPVAGQAGRDTEAAEGLDLVLDRQVGFAQQRFRQFNRQGRRVAPQLQAALHVAGTVGASRRRRALGTRRRRAQQQCQAQQAGQQRGGQGSARRHGRTAPGGSHARSCNSRSRRARRHGRRCASGILADRFHPPATRPMIELNPIRQRIADLQDRLASLRGYL